MDKVFSQDGYDAVVVGSGYGGSAAACRMSLAGIKVCLLEKGRRWEAKDFPTNTLQGMATARTEHKGLGISWGPKDGLYRFDVQDDSLAFTICGLGGGSLSNAGLIVPTPARVKRDPRWPKEWQQDWNICEAAAMEILRPQSLPEEFATGKVMREISDELEDFKPGSFKLSMNFGLDKGTQPKGIQPSGTCTACGNCVAGCPYNAKLSTDKNYVAIAIQAGCTVITECPVRHVVKNPDVDFEGDGPKQRRRWRVYQDNLEYVSCDFVVVSAGVLGTAEILFQSERRGLRLSQGLGFGFSNNGNHIAFIAGSPAPLNALGLDKNQLSTVPFQDRPGPSISTSYTSSLGFTIQTSVFPPAYPHLVFKGIVTYGWPSGYWFLHGLIDKLKQMMGLKASQTVMLNMIGPDACDGRITLDESTDKICFSAAHDPLLPRKLQAAQKLTNRIGGILFMPRYRSTSVHLLGGCIAAADPSHGVCNPSGQVFDPNGPPGAVHAGLYVCDASLIPCSIGLNPSLTIAAAAEHVSRELVQDVQKYKRLNCPIPVAFTEGIAPVDVHGSMFINKVVDFVAASESNGERDSRSGSSHEDCRVMRGDNVVLFNETMRGFVGGMQCAAHLEVKLNPSNQKFLNDGNGAAGGFHPLLRGKVGGYVVFASVEKNKLYIIDGKVDLCSINRRTPYAQYMHYYLLLASASGSRYILEGKKIMNPFLLASNALGESTTLHVTFKAIKQTSAPQTRSHSDSREEPLNLTGKLHVSFVELLRSLISVRGRQKGKFIYLLLQSLYRTYISQQPRSIHEEVKYSETNPKTYPQYIDHEITTDDGVFITCKQWKCNQDAFISNERPLNPVLLINGYATESYWLPTEPNDMVRTLLEEGYEAWILEPRLDPRHPSNDFIFEDFGKFDIPAALKKISELHGPCMKVHVIAHCVGGLSIHIALMGGHISCTQIASLSCTNSSMFFRLTTSSLVKMRLPLIPISMAIMGKERIFPISTNSNDILRHRLFRSITKLIPRNERCTCEECEVFSGIFGNTFWHDNVSPTMHQLLKERLPRLPMSAFSHIRKVCLAGHIVDSNGHNAYLMHPERMALPTLYISGGRTLMATPETTYLANRYMRMHQPGFTHRRVVVDGLGHSDLWIGVESYKKVFPHVISHIKEAERGNSGSLNEEESKLSKESLALVNRNDGDRSPWVSSSRLIVLFLAFVLFFLFYSL